MLGIKRLEVPASVASAAHRTGCWENIACDAGPCNMARQVFKLVMRVARPKVAKMKSYNRCQLSGIHTNFDTHLLVNSMLIPENSAR